MPASDQLQGDAQNYVLITAAFNEEDHIAATLDSVIHQTMRPSRWVIVSDGSTDHTDAIVASRASEHPFIRFVRQEKEHQHCFGSKVRALQRAEGELDDVDYGYIGVLDADISFEADYFACVLAHFDREHDLGVGGGRIVQWVNGRAEGRTKDSRSVAGAVQFFRRECFLGTGGFLPIEAGGEDAVIEITARMNGWRVRTFPELIVRHHGIVGEGAGCRIQARFKWGQMNYLIGYHPAYQLARSVYRTFEKPWLLGSLAECLGYAFACARRRQPQVSREVVKFLRKEQLGMLLQHWRP